MTEEAIRGVVPAAPLSPVEPLEYLTTAEVGRLVRTPAETVRYWRHIGTGPRSFKVGRRVLYRRDDVEVWIEKQYVSQGGPQDAA